MDYDVIIVGGGAAGFFNAINLAKENPGLKIAILERGAEFLGKVRISGGGRCNVTHAEFEPGPLTANYPRGDRELLGPFHKFMTGDVMGWFEERGVQLKVEDDNRVFPVTDSSLTIIDCFLAEAKKYNVDLRLKHTVLSIERSGDTWQLATKNGTFKCDNIVIATGSNPKIWSLLAGLGHTIIPPVPSLFTFNINDERIKNLPGIAAFASVQLRDLNGEVLRDLDTFSGPVLITHWGLSGPAVLKLSAVAARILHAMEYRFKVCVNWLDFMEVNEAIRIMKEFKLASAKQILLKRNPFDLPKRLWYSLVSRENLPEGLTWADVNREQLTNMATSLTACTFTVNGKSTFKEEFTTAGGVELTEVDFTTFESRRQQGLYLAGEVLNIDAVTGGFNFQNAWTGGYLAALAISKKYRS